MADFQGLNSLYIPGYRLNETQPTPFLAAELYGHARAADEGVKAGGSPLAKTLFPGKVLHEGRSDAGTNEYDTNKPAYNRMYSQTMDNLMGDPLLESDMINRAAKYTPAMQRAIDINTKTGVPIERTFNGYGTAVTGRTGAQHAARAAEHEAALKDPRNAPYIDYLDRAQRGKLTNNEKLAVLYTGRNRPFLSQFNYRNEEQKNINRIMGQEQANIPENEINAFLKDPNYLAMAYVDRSGIKFPDKPHDWERPVYKQDKEGRNVMVKGSPTYQERLNQYNDFKELKAFEERYPQAKAYLDQRMGKTPEEPAKQNRFIAWALDHNILVRPK